MHVHWQLAANASQHGEPLARHRPHAVRRQAHAHPRLPLGVAHQLLHRGQEAVHVRVDEPPLPGILRHPEACPRVAHAQQHDAQPHIPGGVDDFVRQPVALSIGAAVRLVVKVVELAHRGDARQHHLQEGLPRGGVHLLGSQCLGGAVHGLAPAPEVIRAAAFGHILGAAADEALERVRVSIHEPWQQRASGPPDETGSRWHGAVREDSAVRPHLEGGTLVEAASAVEEVRLIDGGLAHPPEPTPLAP